MDLLLAAIGVLLVSGIASLLVRNDSRQSSRVAATGVVAAAVLGLKPVYSVLSSGQALPTAIYPWSVPIGSIAIGLDVLSAWFLLLVLIVPSLAATFGCEFLKAFAPRKSLGGSWFFYNLSIAGMVGVTIARDGLLFLVAWEMMALASYFLVVFEHEREDVREAGWTYLVASHLGTAFLLALFIMFGQGSDSLDFIETASGTGITQRLADAPSGTLDVMFVLAVVGFGTKAGFMPFHVWLPETYPAAVGHTPAVLSGVMSKMGIYGLLRVLSLFMKIEGFLPPTWWGCLLILIGMVSGVLGILTAVAQHDLRRILAYSSIENIGIICIGLGTGLLGMSSQNAGMAILGLAGALFHVLNHSLFKGLLFLGAAAVEQSTGTGNLNRLGGLLKQIPGVAIPFVIGSVAISGLPPFNGFASEFLIYFTALREELALTGASAVAALSGIAALTLIGGIAAYCFTMVVGIGFLGAPRTPAAASARPVGLLMQVPLWILAAACLAAGLLSPRIMPILAPAVENVTHLPGIEISRYLLETGSESQDIFSAQALLEQVVLVTGSLLLVIIVLALIRQQLLNGREVTESGTWGCGYLKPESTMQYTGSSFAQPLVDLIGSVLQTRKNVVLPIGLFAKTASLRTSTPDINREYLYAPVFRGVWGIILKLRWLQHGRLHLYVLYIAITIMLLLLWSFGFGESPPTTSPGDPL